MNSPTEIVTADQLPDLIGELRAMARGLLNSESHAHSLTPTALAMTALRRAKLSDQDWDDVRWSNRAHFFGVLILAMRHALIDRARRAGAKGRNRVIQVPSDDKLLMNLPAAVEEHPERVVHLYEALARLKKDRPKLADTIEQFYFVGYSIPEMARYSDVSEKTVDRDLKKARILLKKLMEGTVKAI